MSRKPVCVCGHPKVQHDIAASFAYKGETLNWRCFGPELIDEPCACEGYLIPVANGERPVFGVHRIPRKAAETAPAWPPLGPLR